MSVLIIGLHKQALTMKNCVIMHSFGYRANSCAPTKDQVIITYDAVHFSPASFRKIPAPNNPDHTREHINKTFNFTILSAPVPPGMAVLYRL